LNGNKKALTLEKEIFMSRLFMAVMILGLFLFGILAVPSAQALPKTKMSIYAVNDYPVNLPKFSAWYYPCCNRGTWTFSFRRNYTPAVGNTLNFVIEGLGVARAYGDYLPPGPNSESGTEIVNPQVQHRLGIYLFNPNQYHLFENMTNEIHYWDYTPTHPQPGP
jgi:hypothetical protein